MRAVLQREHMKCPTCGRLCRMDKQKLTAIFHANYRIEVKICHYNGGKNHGVTWSTRPVTPAEREALKRSVLATAARLQGDADERAAADLYDDDIDDDAFADAVNEYLGDANRMLAAAKAEFEFRYKEVSELVAQRRQRSR